mmetsp:Transcript_38567/g.62215  ORF Transcript_38567/g.62215 Transcript_38567/m.62215 type:complete len:217 (-) Transcript_38567:132-782(-)
MAAWLNVGPLVKSVEEFLILQNMVLVGVKLLEDGISLLGRDRLLKVTCTIDELSTCCELVPVQVHQIEGLFRRTITCRTHSGHEILHGHGVPNRRLGLPLRRWRAKHDFALRRSWRRWRRCYDRRRRRHRLRHGFRRCWRRGRSRVIERRVIQSPQELLSNKVAISIFVETFKTVLPFGSTINRWPELFDGKEEFRLDDFAILIPIHFLKGCQWIR